MTSLNNASVWFIIANPTSGNGKFSKNWIAIKALLTAREIPFKVAFTSYSTHEIQLVDNAVSKGFRTIICAGGDGTLHNVVNGIMLQRYVKTTEISLGVIPLGTGNDWIKTYNIPNNIIKAIEIIHNGKTVLQDIGEITTHNTTNYFVNVAGLGFDAYVVQKTQAFKQLGAVSYLLAGLSSLWNYKKTTLEITINNEKIVTKSFMTIVGICKYCGGGMQFTTYKSASDGLFDITIFKDLSFLELLKNIKNIYKGNFKNEPKIETYLTDKLTIKALDNQLFIQADGEIIPHSTASFSIVQKALKCYVS